jgi:OFA family oxalate/formate antiporter-like MFS transporter
VPLASGLQAATGSWHVVFVIATVANLVVAALALFVLKPWRLAHHINSAEVATTEEGLA